MVGHRLCDFVTRQRRQGSRLSKVGPQKLSCPESVAIIFDRRKIQQDFPGEDIEICIDVILRSIPREAFSYLAAGDIDGDIGARFKRGR